MTACFKIPFAIKWNELRLLEIEGFIQSTFSKRADSGDEMLENGEAIHTARAAYTALSMGALSYGGGECSSEVNDDDFDEHSAVLR